jgi:deoxyribodipyrimidine photo-lyase
LLENVVALSRQLASLGIPRHVETVPRFNDVPVCLLRFARKHRCDALFFNREYEVNERRRDHAVERCFAQEGIVVHVFMDQAVFQPGELLSSSGGFYTGFTPFRKAFMDRVRREGVPGPLPAPKRRTPDAKPGRIPRSVGDFDSCRSRPGLWPAGQDHALARLDEFVAGRSRRYDDARDLPGADGTSRLSPYLALGAVSVRQCLTGRSGPQSDEVPWRHDEWAFRSSSEGRTGYPIVDAGMRQLTATGWNVTSCGISSTET